MAAEEAAPAKVNLTLRVVGRRASDGYHLLDSLVVFAGAADQLVLRSAVGEDGLSLVVEGPEAGGLAGTAAGDNLVLRAARALAAEVGLDAPRAALRLDKRLPVASGIGGGSSDAAAALRLLARAWGVDLPRERLAALALRLGADVPMCLDARPVRVGGIGEALSPAPRLPDGLGIALANPRAPLATPAVFAARAASGAAFSDIARLPDGWADARAMADDLRPLSNDLEAAAVSLLPPVAEVLAALAATPGCLLARMSGSGATCFGLFATPAGAERAAAALPAALWRWGGGLFDPARPS